MISAGLCVLLCLTLVPTAGAVGTSASCAVLMEAESGRVLYQQEPHQRRLIASITKLMTALVALESGCPLDEPGPVPEQAVGVEGSSIYLRSGEEITLRELLYGMMLKSGNDAATAVAIRCGGSVEDFAARMNDKAQELGMAGSHFANPSGLNDPEHYSTAHDMALLARACLKNEDLAQIVSTKSITLGQRTLTNHNKLLWRYPGCVGLKTGYTEKAGRTLVSAATRDGMTLIAVTLNDGDDWRDHAALLDWGFAHYVPVRAAQRGAVYGRLPVEGGLVPFVSAVASEDVICPVGAEEKLDLALDWDRERCRAPVEQGERLGTLRVQCGDTLIREVPLTAAQSVARDLAPERRGLAGLLTHIFER